MENNKAKGGLTFLEVLQLIFIVLKLCKVIKWSWLVVFLPSLIPWGIVIILLAVLFILTVKKEKMEND